MSFNTDALTLLVLGIQKDKPLAPDQPPLVDGIHLRWGFEQKLGFPWYGFYLFRRESQPRKPRCLSQAIRDLRPGPSKSTSLRTRLGRLTSSRPLLFTEDFSAADIVEVDLAGGLRFELSEGLEAGRVEVKIGLRETGPRFARTCVDFRRLDLGFGPNPRTEKEVVFEVEPSPASGDPGATSIESWAGSPRGLVVSPRTTITLPCRSPAGRSAPHEPGGPADRGAGRGGRPPRHARAEAG